MQDLNTRSEKLSKYDPKIVVLQLCTEANNTSLNSPEKEGHYDNISYSERNVNPPSEIEHLSNNIINNNDRDHDDHTEDSTKNGDHNGCTEKVTSSTVKCVSSKSKGSSPFMWEPLYYYISLFIFYPHDPQSDGRGSERTVINQLHRQTFSMRPVYKIMLFLSLFAMSVATPDNSCISVPHSYPQCEGNLFDMTAPYWNHSILYMQSNKLSTKGNQSFMMSVYERQMDFKIMYDLFYCLLLVSCILFLLWYIVRLWIPLDDNAVQENDVVREQAHPQKMPCISAPSSLDSPSNNSTTPAPLPLFDYHDRHIKTALPAASDYNYLVSFLGHTGPPLSSFGGGEDDGDDNMYWCTYDPDEPVQIHSIVTSADSNSHLLVYQKTRKMIQKSQSSLLILTKDNALISERLDNPGDNLAVVGKAEYLEESDDDRYLHSQEQECIKSADQLKVVREKGKKVSYSGDLSNSIIPIHHVHKNNIILENTLCVPNPPNQYPTSLKSYLPPPQSPSLMPSLELGCSVFTEAGYVLSGCIAGPEEQFGLIELIPDNDNDDHADPEPVVGDDDDDSVHDNGLYPCCFDVPCTRPFLAQSGP